MTLHAYNKKRSFEKTPEPKGSVVKKNSGELSFVIHKHSASHLHYDLRLEINGVLKSWAVPKGPSMNPKIKHLAVMVEDHPYEYRNFEGVIPAGQYGAGPVIIWDQGTYESTKPEVQGEAGIHHALKKGLLEITFHGKKIKGSFALIKTHTDKDSWLLVKLQDQYAGKKDITKLDKSIKSGKTIDQLKKEADKKTTALDLSKMPGAKKTAMPKKISPMLATLVDKPFNEEGWIFEIKWDGYRAL